MAATATTTLTGTIQKYFEKAWMEMPEEDFRTPLANSDLLQKATIPKHKGQYAEFRKFTHMTPTVASATDATPKTYAENTEPASGNSITASIIQVPMELIRDYVDLGAVQLATDPIDLMKKYKEALQLLVRRTCHMLTNSHMVKDLTRVMQTASIPPATTYLAAAFRTVYAGRRAAFGDLTADDVFTMQDFKRIRVAMANSRVPRFGSGRYVAVIDEAIQAQLLEDIEFKDAVKRHADMYQKASVDGKIAAHEGFDFIVQDDPYRCALDAAGGALANRDHDGAVHVAHCFGKDAAGYVPFGGAESLQRTALKPKFKVQDISITGTNITVGLTLPFQAAVLDRGRGLNLAGCTRFGETVDELAI